MPIRPVLTILACASLLLGLFGCQNPANVPSNPGGRSVTLTWGWGNQGNRMLVPTTFPAVATYDVTLTPPTGAPVKQTGLTATTWTVSALPPLNYAVLVEGRDPTGKVIAMGTGAADLTESSPAATAITLAYVTSGNGMGQIHLTIAHSRVSTTGATLTLTSPNGDVTTTTLVASGNSYTYSATNAPVGVYHLFVTLTGARTASKLETLLVAQNIDTAATITFARADFHDQATVATVSTLAGEALVGSADGIGNQARFYEPTQITTDGTNLFVTDSNNHTIRKIVIATGVVTTLAGTAGLPGSEDGTGIAARFDHPNGITTDDGTNLFVTDSYNSTIRKIVTATGVVTTLAGAAGHSGSRDGTRSAARFYQPEGIATDGSSLFITDGPNTIRQVAIATGVVTTLAGEAYSSGNEDGTGSAAKFNHPLGIETDGTSVFVADTNNHTIRKVVIATGVVTTLAGTPEVPGDADGTGGTARFTYPTGITVDRTNLFVTDTDNNTIRKIKIATGVVTTLAGAPGLSGGEDGTGSTARFSYPRGVASDGSSLFVADLSNHSIRRLVIDTGAVSTFAGPVESNGQNDGTGYAARFDRPNGIATDGTSLFVADSRNNTIRRIVVATRAVTTLAGLPGWSGGSDGTGSAARFNQPAGVATDGTNLFVTDSNGNTIRKVVIATGVVTTLAGAAGQAGSADGTGSVARFHQPRGIATDGTSLFVADTRNHTIRKVVIATGVVTTLAGAAGLAGSADGTRGAARFDQPDGITTDGTNLFVADTYNFTIRKVAIATGVVTTLAGEAGFWGSEDGSGSVARFAYPSGIATDGSNLFVTDGSSTIRRVVTATGDVTTLAGAANLIGSTDGSGVAARFYLPNGIATDDTSLFVTDTYNNTIRVIE